MNKRGITLIELLIVLVISSILIAGIYRTFIRQQQTFTVQEQVVDMQQNVRMAINQMVREIRMAGLGRQDAKTWGASGMHSRYKNIVTSSDDGLSITVVGAYQQITFLTSNAASGTRKFTVDSVAGLKINGGLQYISLNGTESQRIQSIVGNEIELFDDLLDNHLVNEPVYRVLAITYSLGVFEGKTSLMRSDNLPDPDTAIPQPVAENIELLQFSYTLADGTVFVGIVPGNRRDEIRVIEVTIRARTDRNDPELGGGGDGFRRRTLISHIQLRNLTSL